VTRQYVQLKTVQPYDVGSVLEVSLSNIPLHTWPGICRNKLLLIRVWHRIFAITSACVLLLSLACASDHEADRALSNLAVKQSWQLEFVRNIYRWKLWSSNYYHLKLY